MKEKFILDEIWTLTFAAAFQRASVYKNGITDVQKKPFKTELRRFIEEEVEPQYKGNMVNETDHIGNIYRISEHSARFSQILNGTKINFGVSQKILNLHLKYLWCLDRSSQPPHFPVDRRIQETFQLKPILPWTDFKDHHPYRGIIEKVRQMMPREFKSVAEYELSHFKRRVKTSRS